MHVRYKMFHRLASQAHLLKMETFPAVNLRALSHPHKSRESVADTAGSTIGTLKLLTRHKVAAWRDLIRNTLMHARKLTKHGFEKLIVNSRDLLERIRRA